jgi:hypothetical protein
VRGSAAAARSATRGFPHLVIGPRCGTAEAGGRCPAAGQGGGDREGEQGDRSADPQGPLGYSRYRAQGGDWGSGISRELGIIAPQHVIGAHLNTLSPHVSGEAPELDAQDRERVERPRRFRLTGSGYGVVQSTRPRRWATG